MTSGSVTSPVDRPAPVTADLSSWVEIDAKAYRSNLALFRRLAGHEVELSAVLKANAYGHGATAIAALAREPEPRADSFCVFTLDEALALRRAGHRCDILIFGPVGRGRLAEVVAGDLRLALFDIDTLAALEAAAARSGRKARVHLKVETGTRRFGFDAEELPSVLARLQASPAIVVEGAFTHFANIEDTTDQRYAREQLDRFRRSLDDIARAGIRLARRHAACTAALLTMPETALDLVRLGIGQFGFWPSKETRLSFRAAAEAAGATTVPTLRPVLTWKARIAQLKQVPRGAYVGYGCTWQTTRETRLAVLPVGYADGYDRRLSNQSWVLVRGCRAPVRGRVCMNLMMVDVTDVPEVAPGDEVVLLGSQGAQEVSAEQLAGLIGTIHYEVTTRIHADLPRLVV